NRESDVPSSLYPRSQFAGQVGGPQRFAVFVQRYSYTVGRNGSNQTGFFRLQDTGNQSGGRRLLAARGGFDFGKFNARSAGHAPGIFGETGRDPIRRFVANGQNMQ